MEKHTFEPIFGFNLVIDHSCEKTGELVIQSLGVHKEAQERFSEYKKIREEFIHRLCPTDVLLKGRSAPQPALPTWMEADLDQEFALPFATSLYYHKKIQVEEKSKTQVPPEVLDALKRKKWEIENNFERELNYFRNHARYNPIRNLRDCRRPGCAIHRTTKETNNIRYLFEQSLLEEVKILISKINLNDSQDFVYTTIPSFYLFQDLINLTKIIEKLPIRRIRINLIDSEYTEWLSIFRDLFVLNNKTGSQNCIFVKPSVKVEENVIGVTASRDPANEPINVAKLLEINDTIYQFVEWFNNYLYPKITHMSIVMYNNLNSYVEECKLNVSARSHALVSCACQCSSALPLEDIHNTIIQEMSSIVAPHCRYLQLHADTSIESPNSPIKLRIYDSTSKLRKYYDFAKKSFKAVPTPSAHAPPNNKPPPTTKTKTNTTTTTSTTSNGSHKQTSHESKDPPITIPPWATPLTVKEGYYILEVIKQSKCIDTITFNDTGKQYYLIGRNADVCDVELKHPFISRQHAVIFFNVNEEPYITDLSSAHGTFIDSEKIQANVPYPLQEGNIVRFGTSSRKYLVVKKALETASSEDSGNPDDDSSESSSSESSSSSSSSPSPTDTAKRTSSMMSINYLLESNDNEDEPSYEDNSPKKKKANKNF